MIGSRLIRYLRPVPPRYMSRLHLFMGFLNGKVTDATMRASHITPDGYGSRLLTEVIKLADLDTLLTPGDPNHRTNGEYLLSITRDLEKPVDVRIGKHTTRSLFIHSKTPCYELITPSRRKNPLLDLPIGKPYSHPDWKTVKPLRISDMGPSDLSLRVYNDRIDYLRAGPTYAIYSLDCLALVTMFVAYYKAQKNVVDLDQTILDFIHFEVIVPTLLNDSVALWLRNVYRQQLLFASPLESHTSTIWDNVTIDVIGSDFTGAMVDVQHLKEDLKSQSISDLTALSSLLVTKDSQDIMSYYRDLYETTIVPEQQPYVWIDCLKNLAWLEFFLLVTSFVPDRPDAISFQRDLVRDVRLWTMMRAWQDVHSSVPYKTMIRAKLEGMLEYLKQR